MLPNISIRLTQGTLGQVNTISKTPAFILEGVAIASTLALNTPYEIFTLNDAIALGIEEGGVNDFAYKQLAAFYEEAGVQVQLFIMVTDQTLPTSLDLNNEYAKKLITYAKGSVRVLAAVSKSSGSEVIVDGLDENAHLAVDKAQALADSFTANHRPFRVIIGGNAYNGTPALLKDYKEDNKNRVAMFIGADDDSESAAVGRLLGRVCSIPVQRKPSRVLDGPVNGVTEAFLTDGNPIEDAEASWDAIHDKGYIFYRNHVGRSGYFYTSDPTLTSNTDDYNSLARGFVIDKAYLIGYDVLLNHLSDELDIAADGTIAPALVKAWEGEIENALNLQMTQDGEVSAVDVFIDHEQNVLSTNTLSVEIKLQPKGYSDFINVDLGYTITVNN